MGAILCCDRPGNSKKNSDCEFEQIFQRTNEDEQNHQHSELSKLFHLPNNVSFSPFLNSSYEQNINITKATIIQLLQNYLTDSSFTSIPNKNPSIQLASKPGTEIHKSIPVYRFKYSFRLAEIGTQNLSLIPKIMNEIINFIYSPSLRTKWDKNVLSVQEIDLNKFVEDSKKLEEMSPFVKVIHFVNKSPMIMMKDRDYIQKRIVFMHQSKYFVFYSSLSDSIFPEIDKYVRGVIIIGGSIINNIEDTIIIELFNQTDFKFSNIPQSMANNFLNKSAESFLKSVLDHLSNFIEEEG